MLTRAPAGTALDRAPAEPAVVADPGEPPEPVEATPASCENSVLGYSLTYPDGWFTATAPDAEACRYFDTTTLERPSGEGLPATAIRIYLDERTYRYYDRRFDPEVEADVLDRLNLKVGGHPAFRVELATFNEEDGDSTLYAYVVDVGGAVLVLDANAPYFHDYPGAKAPRRDRFVARVRLGRCGMRRLAAAILLSVGPALGRRAAPLTHASIRRSSVRPRWAASR